MAHQKHSWQQAGSVLAPVLVMDDWLGPTLALLQCDCGQYALAHLVAWQGRQLRERIFAVRPVDGDAAETYLANVRRDYCDLSRKQAETGALLQASGDATVLVRTEAPRLTVKAAVSGAFTAPFTEWREVREDQFETWQNKFSADSETK